VRGSVTLFMGDNERLKFYILIVIIASIMRIKLTEKTRTELFLKLSQNKSTGEIADILHVSKRTIKEWGKGNNTIPEESFKKIIVLSCSKKNHFPYETLPENWNASDAARKGGIARNKLRGNPGTKEGRIKGGLKSLKIHNALKTGFKIEKKIRKPGQSEELAEMLGILVGDGHLSEYQASMTTNSVTDIEHAFFVSGLFKKLFNLEAPVQKNSGSKSVDVIASSKKLVGFLVLMGMTKGNKIHNGLHIPIWIMKNKKFWRPFIRGLFDTDGCARILF